MTQKDLFLAEKLKMEFSQGKPGTESLVRELDKLREKSTAIQTHNSYLIAEIERLEAEKAVRSQSLDRLKKEAKQLKAAELLKYPNNNQIHTIEELKTEVENLKNK